VDSAEPKNPGREHSTAPAEDHPQFLLRALQDSPFPGWQRPTGSIDVEIEHRHRGLKRLRLAARAPLG
jgi:hypothetical protein